MTTATLESIEVPTALFDLPPGCYALTVEDNRFIDALLAPGDTLFVRPIEETPADGDLILCEVIGRGAFVRRWQRTKEWVSLFRYDGLGCDAVPLVAVTVKGKVVGMVRWPNGRDE